MKEEGVARSEFAVDLFERVDGESDASLIGDELRPGFTVFEAPQSVRPFEDPEATVFLRCGVEGDHHSEEIRVEEFPVVISVVLMILPPARVRILLCVEVIVVAHTVLPEIPNRSDDRFALSDRTVGVFGEPAAIDEARVDPLFVIVLVEFGIVFEFRVGVGDFEEPLYEISLDGVTDDQEPVLVERCDLAL